MSLEVTSKELYEFLANQMNMSLSEFTETMDQERNELAEFLANQMNMGFEQLMGLPIHVAKGMIAEKAKTTYAKTGKMKEVLPFLKEALDRLTTTIDGKVFRVFYLFEDGSILVKQPMAKQTLFAATTIENPEYWHLKQKSVKDVYRRWTKHIQELKGFKSLRLEVIALAE